jgi:hypothetical protein
MPRPKTRDALLHRDTAANLRHLFGSPKHAVFCLGLDALVQEADMARAMRYQPVTEQQLRAIEARWAEWRKVFLADPAHALTEPERRHREQGYYIHPSWRDPQTGEPVVTLELVAPFRLPPVGSIPNADLPAWYAHDRALKGDV